MSKHMVTIEDWMVVPDVISATFAELRPGNRLAGYVYGHAHLPNAKMVYTSPILSIDLNQGYVETHNTVYRLGQSNDLYKSWEDKRKNSIAA